MTRVAASPVSSEWRIRHPATAIVTAPAIATKIP
jgi:hypothetical protein